MAAETEPAKTPAPHDEAPTGGAAAEGAPAERSGGGAGSVKHFTREAVRLYKNIDKVDRMGGYGWTLSTVIKIAGWTGLIAVLAILVVKLRDIEQQLDPVSTNVAKLEKELDKARTILATQVRASQVELEKLEQDSQRLRAQVTEATTRQARQVEEGVNALKEAEAGAKTIATRLASEGTALEGVSRSLGEFATNLDGLAKSAAASRASVEEASGGAGAALRSLGGAVSTASQKATALGESIGKLRTPDGELDRAEKAADTLAEALARATQKAKALEAKLEARTAALAIPAPAVPPRPSAAKDGGR